MDAGTGPSVASNAVATNCALWIVTAIATITFAGRVYSRSMITGDIGWEDLVMAIGWSVSLAASIVLSLSINASIIAEQSAASMAANLPIALKLDLISVALGINALFLPKISIALLLVRLLKPKRWLKLIVISTALIAFMLGVVGVIIEFVQCNPIPGQWDPQRYNPTCWNPNIQMNYSYFVGAFSAFLDFAYAAYPAAVFYKLKISTVRKVEISILMGLGTISGAVAIYKTSLLHLLSDRKAGVQTALYESTRLGMWTDIEANIIITAACIPLTSPIFRIFNKHAVVFLNSLGFNISTATTPSTTTSTSSNTLGKRGYHAFSRGPDSYPTVEQDQLRSIDRQVYVVNEYDVRSHTERDSDAIPLAKLEDMP